LDQLYKRRNRPPAERLAFLNLHCGLVEARDDLSIEQITLFNLVGDYEEAYARLMRRNFHPWEGGEGKVTTQYIWALVQKARAYIEEGRHLEAIEALDAAQHYPPNLGEGKLFGAQENHIFYYLGCAHEALGDHDAALSYWQKAAVGLSEPSSPMYYNDQPPDMIFYQGQARQKLGQHPQAAQVFQKLIDYGRLHLDDDGQMDYFAVSLPDFLVFDDDLSVRNRIHCHYMMALGYLGQGQDEDARRQFDLISKLDANHLGAEVHRKLRV
jgi:tetratricopeptide (TPR) repeat protein